MITRKISTQGQLSRKNLINESNRNALDAPRHQIPYHALRILRERNNVEFTAEA